MHHAAQPGKIGHRLLDREPQQLDPPQIVTDRCQQPFPLLGNLVRPGDPQILRTLFAHPHPLPFTTSPGSSPGSILRSRALGRVCGIDMGGIFIYGVYVPSITTQVTGFIAPQLAGLWTRYLDDEIDFGTEAETTVHYEYYR
ncbi:hypothetical protein ACTMTI_40575 [Nonomuraea sp. H19]|uniref:hypothetical protein n=1 Tax=Nonomuraea sp. H19 TaxID=3452206 RepID=UPI003F88A5F0